MDRSKASSLFPRKDKTSSSRIILSTMVFISIVVNCLVPRFFIGSLDPEFFSGVLKTQAVVLEYFSFSALPLDIVNSLFSGNRASSDTSKTKPASKKDTAGKTPSEFNFISVEKVQNIQRALSSVFFSDAVCAAVPLYSLTLSNNSLDPPWGACASIFCVFLMCVFLLPRSDVAAAAIIVANSGGSYTRFDRSNRVFLLLGKPALLSGLSGPTRCRGMRYAGFSVFDLMQLILKDFIYFPDGRKDMALYLRADPIYGNWSEKGSLSCQVDTVPKWVGGCDETR